MELANRMITTAFRIGNAAGKPLESALSAVAKVNDASDIMNYRINGAKQGIIFK